MDALGHRRRWLVASCIVAVIAWVRVARSVEEHVSALSGVPISSSLEPIDKWPPAKPLLTTGEHARPLLFSSLRSAEAVASLPCLRTWLNISHLSRRDVSVMAWTQPQHAAGERAEFTLARGREAEFAASKRVGKRDLTLAEFWEIAADMASDELVYHSSPVSSWGDASLTAEADGALAAMSIHDSPSDISDDSWPLPSGPIAWMGSAGVVATAHYDKSLNVVLQVLGTKRWLLWPPEQLDVPPLLMHPSGHPSRRQVRTQILEAAAASHTDDPADGIAHRFARSPAVAATLSPGQLLYVPPYWTHAVESLTPALSLSVLSPSWSEAAGARIAWPALPFGRIPDGAAGRKARVAGVALYLRALLPDLWPYMDMASVDGMDAGSASAAVVAFASHAYEARHAELHPTAAEEIEAEAEDDWRSMGCAALREAGWPADGGALPTHGELTAAVDQVVRHAARGEERADGGPRHLAPAVVRTLMSDYVEQLAGWAVGDALVGELLRVWSRCTVP